MTKILSKNHFIFGEKTTNFPLSGIHCKPSWCVFRPWCPGESRRWRWRWSRWPWDPSTPSASLRNQSRLGGIFKKGRKVTEKRPPRTYFWILQQLHSKTVLAHISALKYKCTIKYPFHTTATWKVWNFMKNTSLCSIWRNKLFEILY